MYVKDKEAFTFVDENHPNAIRLVQQMSSDNGIVGYVDKKKLPEKFLNKIVPAGCITINPDQPLSYYQENEFIGNSIIILDTRKLNKNSCLWIVSEIQRIRRNSTWNDKFPKAEVYNAVISLPTKNNKIDFDFMESFVAELEVQRVAELEAYLSVTGLKDTRLLPEEEQALLDFEKIQWGEFNLEKLYGKSTRGKRLKSADRIDGTLPFVTAGEADEGISAFIGNDVQIFSENTTTIDMFGSAKYRNYKYGSDDHIAVVHTENLSKFAAIFLTSAIHKSSHNGQFDYGRNFYAKDADALNIMLPVIDNKPDYDKMRIIISAIHKLVIKDVVAFSDKRIAATKSAINK